MAPDAGRPASLSPDHQLTDFSSGAEELDRWLRDRSRANEQAGASRTFVTCHGRRVVGYDSISAFSLQRSSASGRARRNMPDPIPAVLLGRLAVDQSSHGVGLGSVLLRDAMRRTIELADQLGIKLLVAQALDRRAADFYLERGFEASTTDPLLVFVLVSDLRTVLADE